MDHSEVKHLPKVDHAPAQLEEWQKLLLKAADLIESYGLAKHTTCNNRGAMCLRGALLVAAGAERVRHGPDMGQASNDVLEADNKMRAAVRSNPAMWNNEPARTEKEVVAKMRAVALGG